MKWALGLWALVIFATSCTVIHSKALVKGVASASSSRVTEASFQFFWDGWWWLFVKGYHALEFAILAILAQKSGLFRSTTMVALACIAYAASDEWHQTFVSDRGGRWTDVVIDSGGVLVGLTLLAAWEALRKGRARR